MAAMKRKRVVLTIQEKLEIIEKLEKGGNTRQLSIMYGIGEQTVRDLKKRKAQLLSYASSSGSATLLARRKSMKQSTYKELDRAMLEWFNQQRAEGTPVSGIICAKQAKAFFNALGMEGDFNASTGWLTRFKQRHGIRELNYQGEKSSGDQSAAADFREDFEEFTESERLQPEQIYNADETGLYWKSLPARTLAFENEHPIPSHKLSRERLTVLCCVNATGSHKLKLCVVGKAEHLHLLREANPLNMPIDCFNHKEAWMDCTIFKEWFDKKFVPQVREHLLSKGLPERAVLLLDYAPSKPSEGLLKSEDGNIFVKYLPPNVAALIQPMDQGVIACMKRHYRTGLLRKHVQEGHDMKSFGTTLTAQDAITQAVRAWNLVKPVTIVRSWRKIISDPDEEGIPSAGFLVHGQQQQPRGHKKSRAARAEERRGIRYHEAGNQSPADNETMTSAEEIKVEPSDSEGDERELIPEGHISHGAALSYVEILLDYLEQQEDSLVTDKLVLHRLRTTIRKKEDESMGRVTVTDFLTNK
ncbi:jerky protein homolog-like [Vombatus ursinus]|uniref:HTH CENPB-type domain-containing protein n=1 Tax=Vombatus ursinus TaxID=29139 RepID=A0A4X2KMH0_VOMUR|nr:jerky protein homolog-like [Vombatus ursinus]XP_027696753.1 jerky protein homolog-like [Vombatus ursinus]XP_027696754.1 jerky protein homolog-like [Vombatus ursinus]XP_027696755.1 jerky protein homolog-like [Vombatus ursinus]XP_027696756.1 jerky protein homolog-like [Vombatus ursinus]XP_027696757.1 jerky protein homolog-like [Vombatus ursinus]XP_027696758.1 jerky protein homolog-like [Vombatus ursinus]XP_027696759.1 jerky protein homolog-like [Vombatus ursinus]